MPKKKVTMKKPSTKEEKGPRSLAEIAKEMETKYPGRPEVDHVATGSLILDDVVLDGGYPRGRIVEVYGQTGTGKSTIVLSGCQAVCTAGMRAVFIDAEQAMNQSLMDGTEVTPFDKKSFFLHKATTFPKIEELMESYLGSKDPPELIVIDSAQAMLPSKKALEGTVENAEPGLQARFMSSFLQKFKPWLGETNTCLIIINQVRMKFNKRGRTWEAIEGSAGGNALKFYSDIRLELRAGRPICTTPKDMETHIGNDVYVKTVKNKVSSMHNGVISVLFGIGISNIRALFFYLEEVTHSITPPAKGAYYKVKLGKHEENVLGRNGVVEWIKTNYDEVVTFLKAEEVI